jgi:hypothetical protein
MSIDRLLLQNGDFLLLQNGDKLLIESSFAEATSPQFPDDKFVSSSFFLETNTQTFVSSLNRAMQRLELAGQRWRASWTLPPQTKEQAAQWIAFFLKCKGQLNSFSASDPDWQVNLGAWSGTPLVKGAGQTGNSLVIDGCSTNITGWGKAGDYFTVNSKLKRLTSDCNTNASGETTLQFEPPIYTAPADNSPLIFNPATANMILTSDTISEWTSSFGRIYESKTITAVEAL